MRRSARSNAADAPTRIQRTTALAASSSLVAVLVLGAVAIDGPIPDEAAPARGAAAVEPGRRGGFAEPVAADRGSRRRDGDASSSFAATAGPELSGVVTAPRARWAGAVAFTSRTNRYGANAAMGMLVWPCAP